MAVVMIGVGPHKGSHTAAALSAAEERLGELRVRASAEQVQRLLAWAAAWPERTWAVEGAGGMGQLPAQQLLAAGERVLDVQPKLAARVRLLAAGNTNKNDPNDARSVAVAALRSTGVREACREDHPAVLKVWSKRYKDLGRSRTQVACRLHAVLRADPRRGLETDHRRAGRADPGIGHPGRGRCRRTLGARRRARRRPARHRCPDPPDPQEDRCGCPGRRDQPDWHLRRRPGDRCRRHRRCPRRVPVPQPGPLRLLQRHRPRRGLLGPAEDLPAVPARQPAAQPRDPHGRGHPDPLPAQRWPRLLRQEAGRG